MNHDDLRAKLAAATPLPWEEWQGAGKWYLTQKGRSFVGVVVKMATGWPDGGKANRVAIVAGMNALPGLLDEIERLREALRYADKHARKHDHAIDSDLEAPLYSQTVEGQWILEALQ